MLSWKIGDVTVTCAVESVNTMSYDPRHAIINGADPEALKKMPWLIPDFVTPEGNMIISLHALLVDAPGLKLIVDTCMGNDKPRPQMGAPALHTPFLSNIAAAGFARETVDAVICTHMHIDHVGWNTMLKDGAFVPTFPKARYFFSRTEYEHWMGEGAEAMQDQPLIMADSVKPIFDAGLAELVEADHQISPEIRLISTPGHTPGHVSVVIESKGESGVITGDMMHHPCQIAHPDWTSYVDTDQTLSTATRWRFMDRYADGPVLVIGTHFAAPTAGHIRRDGTSYRFDGFKPR